MFFFFKQKTAYEMRISDWSSDVCSSDLRFRRSPEARAHHPHRWSAGVMSENEPQTDQTPADDTQALTGEPASAAPMRLRAEPPRVTRLSRKVLAGIGLVASVGLGGALVYALQTRDGSRPNEELYSTDNRSTADGLAGLPRDYSGVPRLGPPLQGDLR